MVRIGLVRKRAASPGRTADFETSDSEVTDISTESDESTAEMQSMPDHIVDIRSLPTMGGTTMVAEVAGGVPLNHLLGEARNPRNNALTPWGIEVGLQPHQRDQPTDFAVLPPPENPSVVPPEQPFEPHAKPNALIVVPCSFSRALSNLKLHPYPHKEPQLAFGLTYRTAWKPNSPELTYPSLSTVAPYLSKDFGHPTKAGTLLTSRLQPAPSPVLTQALVVLSGRASQQLGDSSGLVTFALLSDPAPTNRKQLVSEVLEELAAAFENSVSKRDVSFRSEYLEYSGALHCAVTLRLVKALWGNDAKDDAISKVPAAVGGDFALPVHGSGMVGLAHCISPAYEEELRRRKLTEWLSQSNRAHVRPGAEAPSLYCKVVDASRALRSQRRPADAALLLSSRNRSRVQKIVAASPHCTPLLRRAQQPPPLATGHTWKESFHHALQLTDRALPESHVKHVTKSALSCQPCRPPYYEALSSIKPQYTAAGAQDTYDRILATGSTKNDICYELLMLWCGWTERIDKVDALFDPLTWKHAYSDYSLNWLVCLLLSASPDVSKIPEHQFTALTKAYADQLVNEGEWRWAIFVLLTIPDPAVRRAGVVRVLTRHHAQFAQSPSLNLANSFINIPHDWIAEASSLVSPVPLVAEQPPAPVAPLTKYFDL
eukprot:gene2380-3688_t